MTARATAIVTGGGQGIGAAIAERLAAEGHPVGVIDLNEDSARDTVERIRQDGGTAEFVVADIMDEAASAHSVETIAALLGPPLILVNNAGITRDNLLFKQTLEDWDLVIGVHLRGAFLMSRAAQSHMVASGWGRIVNLSSTSALGNRGQANYAAAKAGVQGFTKTLSLELGKFGVTVNAIAPGFISTEMTVRTAERLGLDFEEYQKQAAAQIPVGRVGVPEDIAALAAFLVSHEAGFVSGQVIYAAGGPKA